MSQESHDKLHRFQKKMRDQGTDGFAEGPRPWETWDESGHQANNRVWEGSARRLNGKKHSLGYRILSALALVALTTLLVGIGGVYYTHTQQVAESGIQPLPVINPPRPVIAAADSELVVAAATGAEENLNGLTAPAAGSEPAPDREAVIENTVTANEAEPETVAVDAPVADEPVPVPESVAERSPPVTNGSIDSVAIETVVTEQSITTTVYTRHPEQDEPEIVSAIETTPPPFAHELIAAEQEVTDLPPAEQTDTLVLAAVDTEDVDSASLPEMQHDVLPDEQIEDATMAELTEESSAAVASEPYMESAPEATEDQDDVSVDAPPAEQGEEVTSIALAEESSETTVLEAPAETAAEVTVEQPGETEPVIPAVKTGNWVINLASYTWKSTANRKLALFQQQGVDAEIFEVMINDKPMYRVRVTGFESSRAAKAEIPAVEQKLNLEGAWISKR